MTISLRSTLKSGIVKCWSPLFKSDVLLWITSCLFHPLLTPKPFFGDLLKHLMMFCFFSWGNTLANFAIKKENDTYRFIMQEMFFFYWFQRNIARLFKSKVQMLQFVIRQASEREGKKILSPATQCEEWLEEMLLGWHDISPPVCQCNASSAAWVWGYKALVEGKHKEETQGRSHTDLPLFLTIIWSDRNARPAGNIWGSVWARHCLNLYFKCWFQNQ